MWWLYLLIGVFAVLAGFLFGYAYRRNVAEAKIAKAEDAVKKLYDDAQRKAEEIKKEKILEAKEEVFRVRSDAERENRERRAEVQRNERRIATAVAGGRSWQLSDGRERRRRLFHGRELRRFTVRRNL